MKITCPHCGAKIEIKKSGRIRCKECNKIFEYIGKITFSEKVDKNEMGKI